MSIPRPGPDATDIRYKHEGAGLEYEKVTVTWTEDAVDYELTVDESYKGKGVERDYALTRDGKSWITGKVTRDLGADLANKYPIDPWDFSFSWRNLFVTRTPTGLWLEILSYSDRLWEFSFGPSKKSKQGYNMFTCTWIDPRGGLGSPWTDFLTDESHETFPFEPLWPLDQEFPPSFPHHVGPDGERLLNGR